MLFILILSFRAICTIHAASSSSSRLHLYLLSQQEGLTQSSHLTNPLLLSCSLLLSSNKFNSNELTTGPATDKAFLSQTMVYNQKTFTPALLQFLTRSSFLQQHLCHRKYQRSPLLKATSDTSVDIDGRRKSGYAPNFKPVPFTTSRRWPVILSLDKARFIWLLCWMRVAIRVMI